MINLNFILIKSIKDKTFNFKKLLTIKDTIIWKNCKDLTITVNSKINKFQFDNCSNIKLYLVGTIVGLEISNCNNFTITIPENHMITSIDLYKSQIKIDTNYNEFKKIVLLKEKSKIQFAGGRE